MGFGKDGKGVILHENVTITLSTLADVAAIKASSQIVLGDDFRLISTLLYWSYAGRSDADSVIIGIADNELSVGEIAEALSAQPTDRNDNVGNERAMRPVFELEIIGGGALTEGKTVGKIKETIRWTFSNPEGFVLFAFNNTDAPLDTGGLVFVHAKHFGVWVT